MKRSTAFLTDLQIHAEIKATRFELMDGAVPGLELSLKVGFPDHQLVCRKSWLTPKGSSPGSAGVAVEV